MNSGAPWPISEERDQEVPSIADPFLEAVRCDSGRVDVLGAALALVLDARPDAEVAEIAATLDRWGASVSRRIRHADVLDDPLASMLLLTRFLFEETFFFFNTLTGGVGGCFGTGGFWGYVAHDDDVLGGRSVMKKTRLNYSDDNTRTKWPLLNSVAAGSHFVALDI